MFLDYDFKPNNLRKITSLWIQMLWPFESNKIVVLWFRFSLIWDNFCVFKIWNFRLNGFVYPLLLSSNEST